MALRARKEYFIHFMEAYALVKYQKITLRLASMHGKRKQKAQKIVNIQD